MEPLLDETGLVPCPHRSAAARIFELAATLKALDQVGAQPILRTVRAAADLDISGGYGFRYWCFQRDTNREAGLLVASRLQKQPYIDGPDGLFADAEGVRAIETQVGGVLVYALGLAALEEGIVTALGRDEYPAGGPVQVQVIEVTEDRNNQTTVPVFRFVSHDEVIAERINLIAKIDGSVRSGVELLDQLPAVFPRLRLGTGAQEDIRSLTGSEPVFKQLLRHMRALNQSATEWMDGVPFSPRGITYSSESNQTLNHATYGPMRDFPTPIGFQAERWSMHTKLTGGAGARLYFRAEHENGQGVVLLGYFGKHLPTVRF